MRFRAIVILFMAPILCGCGSNDATLSGRVTFKGEPLVNGMIVVLNSDSTAAKGEIQPDGRYSVSGVSRGIVKIAVVSENAHRGKAAKSRTPHTRPILRHELANPLTSGLQCDVSKSHTEFDLDLK